MANKELAVEDTEITRSYFYPSIISFKSPLRRINFFATSPLHHRIQCDQRTFFKHLKTQAVVISYFVTNFQRLFQLFLFSSAEKMVSALVVSIMNELALLHFVLHFPLPCLQVSTEALLKSFSGMELFAFLHSQPDLVKCH